MPVAIKALMLGFSTGLFCLGYCAPILGPLMLSKKDPTLKSSASSLGLFMLGKLTAYLLFGALVGWVSQYTKEIFFLHRRVMPATFIILGLLMVIYGIVEAFPKIRLCSNFSEKYFQKGSHYFIMGFLIGIHICPPFLLATAYALTLEKVLKSMAFFFFFFLATSVFLVPFIFSGRISRSENVKAAARITSIIVGVWFIFIAARMFG